MGPRGSADPTHKGRTGCRPSVTPPRVGGIGSTPKRAAAPGGSRRLRSREENPRWLSGPSRLRQITGVTSETSHDGELVSAYAREESETAFRALVARHVDLVFATAMRQTGDRGLAEEITQNVFVALARKAPRLTGFETLAGWLHHAAVRESKTRIRSELRRRRREDTAASVSALHREGTAPLEALVPLLDEGLLGLREADRLALILRFIEDRSLREVGELLGVEEDAARKRVARALAKLTGFFQKRGFLLPAGSGATALLAQASQAAPITLAGTAAQAGLAAGGAATGLNLLLLHAMALTKTQTAVLCALVVCAPLAWQWNRQHALDEARKVALADVDAQGRELARLTEEADRAKAEALRTEAAALDAGARVAQLRARRDGKAPRAVYRWDDTSPRVRVTKELLQQMDLDSVGDKRGALTEQIKEALQLTDDESGSVKAAMERFLSAFHEAQAAVTRRVDPTKDDLNGGEREDTRVFEVGATTGALAPLRQELFASLAPLLGPERLELFKRGLRDWMPLDDEAHGLNSSAAVIPFAHRLRFYRPGPTDPVLGWGIAPDSGGMMRATMAPDEVPRFARAELQEWMDHARRQTPPAP